MIKLLEILSNSGEIVFLNLMRLISNDLNEIETFLKQKNSTLNQRIKNFFKKASQSIQQRYSKNQKVNSLHNLYHELTKDDLIRDLRSKYHSILSEYDLFGRAPMQRQLDKLDDENKENAYNDLKRFQRELEGYKILLKI